jgi:hypothetical protein
LLKTAGISFTDLGEMALANFSGQLAVVGPFETKAQMPEGMANEIKGLAHKNVAVVWIQPPEGSLPTSLDWERQKIQPSFYCVQKGQTWVVIVQPDLVNDLAEKPLAQIALIYFCHLALNSQPAVLPGLVENDEP